jgi:pSer/pThr/pTyr-binding forkhead associated (FHA) protein
MKCNEEYPAQLKYEDRAYNIIDFKRPKRPCVVLEKITKKEIGKVNISEITILKFRKQDKCTLGEGPQNDLRLLDNTSSVVHCSIRYKQNRFFLFDEERSRFGTLVLLRKCFPLLSNGIAFQVHNVVFNLFIENKKMVNRLKERKFKRFEVTSSNTFTFIIKNLKTRMKSIPLQGTQTF